MPNVFVQIRIPHRNGIPKDAVMNTFHFSGVDDREDFVPEITGRLYALFCTPPAGSTYAVNTFMSGELNLAGTRAKYYDMDDPEPRSPFADESLGLVQGTPRSVINLPGEVALCSSYRGDLVSGEPPARRRGRIYIGPLNSGALSAGGTDPARPLGTFRTSVAGATQALAAASTLGVRWVVHSRVSGTNTAIEYGWVDDAFDTMRKRGVEATTRSNWSVEIP